MVFFFLTSANTNSNKHQMRILHFSYFLKVEWGKALVHTLVCLNLSHGERKGFSKKDQLKEWKG